MYIFMVGYRKYLIMLSILSEPRLNSAFNIGGFIFSRSLLTAYIAEIKYPPNISISQYFGVRVGCWVVSAGASH